MQRGATVTVFDDDLPLFFYGTLRNRVVLDAVLGHDGAGLELTPARLADHGVYRLAGTTYPVILPLSGATAEGVLIAGLSSSDMDRIWFYEDDAEYGLTEIAIETDAGPVQARAFIAAMAEARTDGPWSLDAWEAEDKGLMAEVTRDFMALMGTMPHAAAEALYVPIYQRHQARRNARAVAPATLRRDPAPGDVRIVERTARIDEFHAFVDIRYAHAGFGGGVIGPILRSGIVSGDVVTVLPYDPATDRVLVVEQVRTGPIMRADPRPWVLETVAGRIDPGESPELAAARETEEEAGVSANRLIQISAYYSTPGTSSEHVTAYVALCDLPDRGGLAGVAHEAEDIRTHVLPFAELEALIASGEVNTGPLLMSAWWLGPRRQALRAGAALD